MRILALVVTLLSSPALALDHTPWPDRSADAAMTLLPEAQLAQAPRCCKHCTKGQPCGDSCISTKKRCKSAPGCAC